MGALYRPTYTDRQGRPRSVRVYWMRYMVRGTQVRESSGTTDKAAALKQLKIKEGEVARGKRTAPEADRVTFTEMAEAVRRDYAMNDKNVATLGFRLTPLEAFFGPLRMQRIIPDDVERYKAARKADGAANGTINRELGVLGRAFTLGVDLGRLTSVYPVRKHKLKEADARGGFFEAEQFAAVLRELPTHLQPVAQFGYETGWRVKEIVSRQWKHVDLEVGTVRLDPGETKNGKGRTVYLTPELGATLAAQREHVTALGRQRRRLVPWVFFRPMGGPIKSFRKAWTNACERAGVPGRLFHDLRRTAVRDMTRRGVVERVAMQVTGHLTRDVFDRYNIVAESDLKAAAEAMAGRVKCQRSGPSSKDIAKWVDRCRVSS